MADERHTVFFLCTGNSARSIMAEAIANYLFGERLEACSGGSHPKDAPNPSAIQTLKRHGVPTDDLRSKSWDNFSGRRFDLVVTLCDSAPGESCPTFPGAGVPGKTHWGFPDPPVADEPEAMFKTVYLRTGRGHRPVRSDHRPTRPTRCGSCEFRAPAVW